ncbi:MAG: hypothetical protein ACR2RF_25060 [Geminicoccaceae bacterium]
MRYLLILILFAFPAFAQTDPAGSLRIGDHQHGTSGLETDLDVLKALFDDHMAVYHTEPVPKPKPDPGPDPGPDPEPSEFDELCDGDGVILCEGFETDLSAADANYCGQAGTATTHCPEIQSAMTYEGRGALQLTTNGSFSQDVSGWVAYRFPPVSTFYVHMRMRYGDGYNAYKDSPGFPGDGEKQFLLTKGPRTCTPDEIALSDVYGQNFWQFYTWCGRGVGSKAIPPPPAGDHDMQPVEGQTATCRFQNTNTGDINGCVQIQDDVWHSLEMAVDLDNRRMKLWIDGHLVIDFTDILVSGDPYDQIALMNYMTKYFGTNAGDGTYGNGLWRIYYDNLIISRECITNCGG